MNHNDFEKLKKHKVKKVVVYTNQDEAVVLDECIILASKDQDEDTKEVGLFTSDLSTEYITRLMHTNLCVSFDFFEKVYKVNPIDVFLAMYDKNELLSYLNEKFAPAPAAPKEAKVNSFKEAQKKAASSKKIF